MKSFASHHPHPLEQMSAVVHPSATQARQGPPVVKVFALPVFSFSMRPVTRLSFVLLAGLSLSGCANLLNQMVPDVYLVDRHTIMESDAAGDWPALEQRLRTQVHSGPTPLAGIDEPLDQQPAFQVLNDEYIPHAR